MVGVGGGLTLVVSEVKCDLRIICEETKRKVERRNIDISPSAVCFCACDDREPAAFLSSTTFTPVQT